ncbi:aminotransferase class IV-domain-containing protein [Aspergillus avenaceus]|uniref:Aminotransferase class IV-domain-containing protein n=1 Tax=Aspergillus avenaceus TaxID=36643 RepID=A0A5N6U8B2_ASPAV|nr:aminotransferase class IV-domain-containing protein [Aspergillus avenaceus]
MSTMRTESVAPSGDFQIISTLRFDPSLPNAIEQRNVESFPKSPYYLLPYHQTRLLNAARAVNWPKAVGFCEQGLDGLVRIFDNFIPDKTKAWRLRILINNEGTCKVEANPTTIIDLNTLFLPSEDRPRSDPWLVYVDTEPTTPSVFTTHKTTVREHYTAARLRAGITSPQMPAEVLVVNLKGEIMEGSITTPYFQLRKSGKEDMGNDSSPKWITPPLSSGGNAGTTRQYALSQGFCTEQVVTAAEIRDGEECWLSNGARGFVPGRIVRNASNGSRCNDDREK